MSTHVTSKHLQTTTELTMIIPVKQGLVDTLDTLTFATRLRRLMRALDRLRKASREQSEFKPISDTVERIETIQSFRLALLDNDTRLLLAVAFDGPWEPYIRKVWYDLGPLLDIIMCNCEHYPLSVNTPFNDYAAWIRRYQVETQFFYTAANLTPGDYVYLRDAERIQRENHNPSQREQQAAQLFISEPENKAKAVDKAHPEQLIKQGLKALGVLDSLRSLYPDGTSDAGILLRATHELLKEFKQFNTRKLPAPIRQQFEPQLLWFEQPRSLPTRPEAEAPCIDLTDIQGGIIEPYKNIQYGALVFFRIQDVEMTRQFLAKLPITNGMHQAKAGIYYNLALTLQGLQQLGLDDSELGLFPEEFLSGMESRAGLLGDVRSHHPSNWKLPVGNWSKNDAHDTEVPLSTIDFIVQLRTDKHCKKNGHEITGNPSHPLYKVIENFAATSGVELLFVEAMASYPKGHFGFKDGISQPVINTKKQPSQWSDLVAPGEILLGHQNDRDLFSTKQSQIDPLLHNGTFLVIRKIQQNVAMLNQFLDESQPKLTQHGMKTQDLTAQMLGRKPDGTPLVPHKGNNDFTYKSDITGSLCPLQSHVRRSNPRYPSMGKPSDKLSVPRIVRRGMSYGPPADKSSDEPRGLIFLAYNASIARQFETIQSWLTGANASNTYSGLADPFLGVPAQGEKRTFRCLSPTGDVLRFDLDPSESDKRPLTELQWGSYCFVPSLSALKRLTQPRVLQPHSDIQTGERWIAELQTVEKTQGEEAARQAWKTAMEDASANAAGVTPAIWSAIRENYGALRTPYGILVGCEDLVDQVLADDLTFSVKGYAERMKVSLGSIYLGMDSGPAYYQAAELTNAAIAKVTEKQGFDLALQYTRKRLTQLKQLSAGQSPVTLSLPWIVDQVLADLSQYWFDIPDGEFILAGGKPAPNKKTLHCPYHFTPPSRYIFSPNTEGFAAAMGEDSGSRLRGAAIEFVKTARRKKNAIRGDIAKPLFAAISDDVELAQNLIGAMMGFLPTAMGLFLKTMYLWMNDKQLPRLQQDFHASIKTINYQNCKKVVMQHMMIAMQKAPVPYMIWRTTTRPCILGNIELHQIKDGVPQADKIVIGISSVTQGKLKKGELDVTPIFGGDRKAAQHPTHSCPGMPLAMGVLLGLISALLEGETLLDSGLPLVVEINPKATE